MKPEIPVIEDSRYFFDLKLEIQRDVHVLEKAVYDFSGRLDEVRQKVERLNQLAEKHGSEYFTLKIKSLQSQIQKIKKKKGYNKIEFDRLLSMLSKIQESERVEFLSEAIRAKIEKIAETSLNQKKKNIHVPDRKNKYFLFNFQRILYLVKSLPKRIMYNVSFSQKGIVFRNQRFPIFPSNPMSMDSETMDSKLVIIRNGTKFLGLRYDFFETELEMDENEIEERTHTLEQSNAFIRKYIKWKGQKCYILEI
jgi:hypothetical protein